jgi:hypothetical protein
VLAEKGCEKGAPFRDACVLATLIVVVCDQVYVRVELDISELSKRRWRKWSDSEEVGCGG